MSALKPPRWLRGFWRQREEGHFREAFTDLVLYSPDRQRLAERAVELAARLVGADGAVIATDDAGAAGCGPARGAGRAAWSYAEGRVSRSR